MVGTVLHALTIYMIKVRRNFNTCKIKILKKIEMKGLKVLKIIITTNLGLTFTHE